MKIVPIAKHDANNHNIFSIQSGWSIPPPLKFLQKTAEGYIPFYRDFFKQWHFRMETTECSEPSSNSITGEDLEFPTSTYYPPGLVCAKEFTRSFCPSPGESGSTLMTRDRSRPDRFVAEGVLSFVKACDVFLFGLGNTRGNRYTLNQQTNNPTAYTKLSCYLPWIAGQYNLEYQADREVDPACVTGTGDIDNEDLPETNVCQTVPTASKVTGAVSVPCDELPCIFPYYINGQFNPGCSQFDLEDLNSPVNFCPVRNITTKLNGINNYPREVVNILSQGGSICEDPSQMMVGDALPPLNPDITDCGALRLKLSFAQCRNNCPGGKKSITYHTIHHHHLYLFPYKYFSELPYSSWWSSTIVHRSNSSTILWSFRSDG